MNFVMVTHFNRHWDQIPGNVTSFTERMLKNNLSSSQFPVGFEANSVFIKINKDNNSIEKIWKGKFKITEIKIDNSVEKIYFRVYNLIDAMDIINYYTRYNKQGWYIEETEKSQDFIIPQDNSNIKKNIYEPIFFNLINKTTVWEEFEDYSYTLLKLIGVNDIYAINKVKQSGKPDGFFKIGNFAVIYDCTLSNSYDYVKEKQIENYIAELKKNPLKYDKIEFDISKCEKRVWIITRGKYNLIKRHENIIIEEVPVEELIKIYFERINKQYDENNLVGRLIKINN